MPSAFACSRCGFDPGHAVSGCPRCLEAEVTAARADPRRAFGRFLLLSELGRGGMGVVHRAWDARLGRVVALKTILPDRSAGADAIQRFRREAEALGRVQHESIVAIHETGETAGRLYLVMDFVPGETLERRLGPGERQLPPRKALEILRDVARAVHHAHGKGVVHRDLKPQNVLVDASDRPHVLDFGLARLADAKTRLTRTNAVVGTPAYMPPEQAETSAVPVDARSDVYSLGAILYHVLTGRPPFQGASDLMLITAVLTKQPLPPSKVNASVPTDLEAVCLRCLEKAPARRYSSAEAFALEIERHLRGEGAKGAPRRPGRVLGLAALVALAGLAAALAPRWIQTPLAVRIEEPKEGLETTDDQVHVVVATSGASSAEVALAPGPDERVTALSLDGHGRAEASVRLPDRDGAFELEVRAHDGRGAVERSRVAVKRRAMTTAELVRSRRNAAAAGDPAAMVELAHMCREGRAVGKDLAEAVRWYRKAAEAGSARGMTSLGFMLEVGEGVAKDEVEAALWYRKGADAGDAAGMTRLGGMLARGRGVAQDEEEAVRWLRKAADAGDPPGMRGLADMLAAGRGATKDELEAVRWFRKAAEAGDPEAMDSLGIMLVQGRGVARDEAESAAWFRKAAEAGFAPSMTRFGAMLEHGQGVARDVALAARWYRKAAEAGDAHGMTSLGVMLAEGLGVEKNEKEGVRWFRQAATKRDVRAMVKLGDKLSAGWGAEQDNVEAVRWYREAAEAGDAEGMVSLGAMLEEGSGGERSMDEAMRWFRRAAALGNEKALAALRTHGE